MHLMPLGHDYAFDEGPLGAGGWLEFGFVLAKERVKAAADLPSKRMTLERSD